MKYIDHAILRAYNNPAITDLIGKIAPVVKHIVVVINGPAEHAKGNNTAELLRSSGFAHKITPVVIENYGWSKALNVGLDNSKPKESYETRLVISNEVDLTLAHLEEMQGQVLLGRDVVSSSFGTFGAPHQPYTLGSYALFEGRNEPTYLLPRNTCTLWRSDAIDGFRFNEELDAQQGMEDVYMGLQIWEEKGLFPSLGPTNVGVFISEEVDIVEKTRKEQATIKAYLKDFKPGTVKAYFGVINSLNVSKGRGGIPLFPEQWESNYLLDQ